ncbi:MAG: LptE family protein [Bacteroidota bacterium]
MTSKIKLLIFLSILPFYGCGVYSLTGASIDYTTVKTVSIQNVYNDTPNGPANLTQVFTERLRDYFQANTNLELVPFDGDLQFEGKIVRYDTQPVAPRASNDPNQVDLSTLTQLNIAVQMKYTNVNDDQYDFDRSFSFQDNFDNTQFTLPDVEDELIVIISDQIIIDIFNASVANW